MEATEFNSCPIQRSKATVLVVAVVVVEVGVDVVEVEVVDVVVVVVDVVVVDVVVVVVDVVVLGKGRKKRNVSVIEAQSAKEPKGVAKQNTNEAYHTTTMHNATYSGGRKEKQKMTFFFFVTLTLRMWLRR